MDRTEKDIDFVARHYRRGLFDADAAWRRLGIAPASMWRRWRAAAIIAVVVALSATAAIVYSEYVAGDAAATPADNVTTNAMEALKAIDFENAPLTDVIASIEDTYGVKVENAPDDAADYSLSLHYEGTPADLITVINEILGTQMTVTER